MTAACVFFARIENASSWNLRHRAVSHAGRLRRAGGPGRSQRDIGQGKLYLKDGNSYREVASTDVDVCDPIAPPSQGVVALSPAT